MAQSSQQTDQTSERVTKSGRALQRIMETIATVTNLVERASQSIAQLNTASQEISAAAEEQFAVMDQIADSAQTLNQMAEGLQGTERKVQNLAHQHEGARFAPLLRISVLRVNMD